MLTEHLETQFSLITKVTSYARGNPFSWNKNTNKLEVNPSKFFQLTRLFLTIWSVLAFVYKAYWLRHALKYNDQWSVDTLLDIVYFGGGLICVFLHVVFHFIQDNVVQFFNELMELHRKLEAVLLDASEVHKLKNEKNWYWLFTRFLQVTSVVHSIMAALIYQRFPEHRRYTYNVILGTVCRSSWLKYPLAVVTFGRLLHRWGALLVYMFLQSMYYQVSSFWMKQVLIRFKKRGDEDASNMHSVLIIRSLQLLNGRYNHLSRHINACCYFNIWFNIVFYGVFTVTATDAPFPEYLVLPTVAIGIGFYELVMFKQMSNVRVSWINYYTAGSQDFRLAEVGKKFLASVRPLGIQLGMFTFVTRLAPVIFIGITIDYMITIILGMG